MAERLGEPEELEVFYYFMSPRNVGRLHPCSLIGLPKSGAFSRQLTPSRTKGNYTWTSFIPPEGSNLNALTTLSSARLLQDSTTCQHAPLMTALLVNVLLVIPLWQFVKHGYNAACTVKHL